jgi:hypothetical protein
VALLDQTPDAVDFFAAETVTSLHTQRFDPELRFAVVPFDVNVWRLVAIARLRSRIGAAHVEIPHAQNGN